MEQQQYLDEKIHQLRIVCQSQWDYLKYSNLSEWLEDNFKNDIEGKYYATKILLHTVYYSKADLEKLLNYGLNEKIYGEIIKEELLSNKNIYISNSEALGKVHKLKQSTFFIPLSDSDKPYESGNLIIGDLVHKLNVQVSQVDFLRNVNEEKLEKSKILVFVDDCIGSGNQLRKFWNSKDVNAIKAICKQYEIQIYYLVLIGYKNNLETLLYEQEITGVKIIVCDLLTDKNRIFSNDNIIWDKEGDERNKAITYFEKVRKQKGVSFLGYTNLDFAVILHNRLPDWSLPIFWRENASWKCLLKRKSSYN